MEDATKPKDLRKRELEDLNSESQQIDFKKPYLSNLNEDP